MHELETAQQYNREGKTFLALLIVIEYLKGRSKMPVNQAQFDADFANLITLVNGAVTSIQTLQKQVALQGQQIATLQAGQDLTTEDTEANAAAASLVAAEQPPVTGATTAAPATSSAPTTTSTPVAAPPATGP